MKIKAQIEFGNKIQLYFVNCSEWQKKKKPKNQKTTATKKDKAKHITKFRAYLSIIYFLKLIKKIKQLFCTNKKTDFIWSEFEAGHFWLLTTRKKNSGDTLQSCYKTANKSEHCIF